MQTGSSVAGVLAAAAVGALVLAAWASADPLERFRDCPVGNRATKVCAYSRSQYKTTTWVQPLEPSTLTVGDLTVPLTRALVIQGGLTESPASGELLPPSNGDPRLVPVAEPVPGGLRSMIDPARLSGPALVAYEAALAAHQNAITVTIELAPAKASVFFQGVHLLLEQGIFGVLPVKVHFTNDFLGQGCFEGSDANPIAIELTDAATSPPPPAEPIRGRLGTMEGLGHADGLVVKEDSLVANGFPLPGVEGCGRAPAWRAQVDAAIDATNGLPSPAGRSSVRIDGALYLTGASVVRERGF
jgi:hypothetical protein